MGVAAKVEGGAKGLGASRTDQKVGPTGGPFRSTVISKPFLQKSRAWTPHPLNPRILDDVICDRSLNKIIPLGSVHKWRWAKDGVTF